MSMTAIRNYYQKQLIKMLGDDDKERKRRRKQSSDIFMGCIRQTMGIPLTEGEKDNYAEGRN
jgi:hypothetical protein